MEKRERRQQIIERLQSRAPLAPEERPVVNWEPEEKLSPEEAARLSSSSWMPHSPEDLCASAILTYEVALGAPVPLAIGNLLQELKYKLQAAEYHLRKVGGGDEAAHWYEAEGFVSQARSALEILARILHKHLEHVPESFKSNGIPIAKTLRNQSTKSPYYRTCVHFAEWIEQSTFLATLSAVRDELNHWRSFPSLAQAKGGVVHLGGQDLDQFCIGFWFSVMSFAQGFIEWTIKIAWEIQNGRIAPGFVQLTPPPGLERGVPRYIRRGTVGGHSITITYGELPVKLQGGNT